MSIFQDAVKNARIPKILLIGPAGSGKTLGALKLMRGLIGDKTMAFIDSESSSASIYADQYKFKHADIPPEKQNVEGYLHMMKEALVFDGLIIDSISPAWDYIVKTANDMPGNSFTNWNKLTPIQKNFAAKIVAYPKPLICAARSKQAYVLEQNEQGKMVPKKVGLEIVQGKDLDYEFDIVFSIDQSTHLAKVDKCRYSQIEDYFNNLGGEVKLSEEIGQLIKKVTS